MSIYKVGFLEQLLYISNFPIKIYLNKSNILTNSSFCLRNSFKKRKFLIRKELSSQRNIIEAKLQKRNSIHYK